MDYIELKAQVEPSNPLANEVLIAQLAEIGFESFTENSDGLSAFIKISEYSDNVKAKLKELILPDDTNVSFQTEKIDDQNWNAIWESNFDPIIVDNKCIVRASFHKNTPKLEYEIVIDPKMAFGTGHHQTTHLMIHACLGEDFTGKKVLDMGCGTGVLAILAEMRGAKAVTAIDIDEWAFQSTVENTELNLCKKIEAQLGDVNLIKGKKYDVILANINLNILIADMDSYYESLLPNGKILFSGILKSDIPTIEKKAKEFGLSHVSTSTRDEWVMISFQKKP